MADMGTWPLSLLFLSDKFYMVLTVTLSVAALMVCRHQQAQSGKTGAIFELVKVCLIYLPRHTALKMDTTTKDKINWAILVYLSSRLCIQPLFCPGHGYQVIYQANYVHHTLLYVLLLTFISPNTHRRTQTSMHMHMLMHKLLYTHRGLVRVSGGLCSPIQPSTSYICPTTQPMQGGYLSPRAAHNVPYHVTRALWVSYWRSKHIHLSPKETRASLQLMKWRVAAGQFIPGKPPYGRAFTPLQKVDADIRFVMAQVMSTITFGQRALWASLSIMSFRLLIFSFEIPGFAPTAYHVMPHWIWHISGDKRVLAWPVSTGG